jgi:hypothetical protein
MTRPHRVLDLDLDLFLSGISHDPSDDRSVHEHLVPWSEIEVRHFLETRCGLNRNSPTPGAVFEKHDGVLWYWRDLIRAGTLCTPFDIVHADSHADLGMGNPTWIPVLTELVRHPLEKRLGQLQRWPGRYNAGPSNFLLFAIALRWCNALTYVFNPMITLNDGWPRDVPKTIMRNHAVTSATIQLPHLEKPDVLQLEAGETVTPSGFDPPVPLQALSTRDYEAGDAFDWVTVALSRNYTPRITDELIPIVLDYIHT